MRIPSILIFIISLNCTLFSQQKNSVQLAKKQNLDIFVGIDLLNPMISSFNEKRTYLSGYAMARIYKNWHFVFEIGKEKNNYDKLGWDIDINGLFTKFGLNFDILEIMKNPNDNVFLGMRYAFSSYDQTINKYTVRPSNIVKKLPIDSVSTSWLELILGAKVEVFNSNIFLGTTIRPRFIISQKKQNNIDNLIIPGFGQNTNNTSLGFDWTISYKIPIGKTHKAK